MRRALSALLLLFILSTNAYADNRSYTPDSLPDTITFNGVEMHKAFEEAKGGGFIVEYIPKGETLEQWVHLFAVRKEGVDLSPLDRARGVAAHLKKQNPEFRSQVLVNKKAGISGIDFLVWPEDGSYGEFNTWKFMPAEPGWLYSFQYARRGYSGTKSLDELGVFMKKKQDAVMEMMGFEVTEK